MAASQGCCCPCPRGCPALPAAQVCVCVCVAAGRRGVYSGCSGLQIAYLSGIEAQEQPAPAHSFSAKDVAELKTSLLSAPNFRGVDILLTSPWPQDVGTFANSAVSVLFLGDFTKGCLSACSEGCWAPSESLRKLGVKPGRADVLVLQSRRTEGEGDLRDIRAIYLSPPLFKCVGVYFFKYQSGGLVLPQLGF